VESLPNAPVGANWPRSRLRPTVLRGSTRADDDPRRYRCARAAARRARRGDAARPPTPCPLPDRSPSRPSRPARAQTPPPPARKVTGGAVGPAAALPPAALVGARVLKDFVDPDTGAMASFPGAVMKYNAALGWFLVRYDDSDAGELTRAEVEALARRGAAAAAAAAAKMAAARAAAAGA
jgi:hypothetical protein